MANQEEISRDVRPVEVVQKVAQSTQTRGIDRNAERKVMAEAFAQHAKEILVNAQQASIATDSAPFGGSGLSSPHTILAGLRREKKGGVPSINPLAPVFQAFDDAVKLHIQAYSKANNDNLHGTIFDLHCEDPEVQKNRSHYIHELGAFLTEHWQRKGVGLEGARKLATYISPRWMNEWVSGQSIERHLLSTKLFTVADVRHLLKDLSQADRADIATGSIKDPFKGLERVAKNYLYALSDTGIEAYLQSHYAEFASAELIAALTPRKRMLLAIEYEDPLVKVENIARMVTTTLSDENIRTHLINNRRYSPVIVESFLNHYGQLARIQIALERKFPLEEIDATAENFCVRLRDENIRDTLSARFSLSQIEHFIEYFSEAERMQAARRAKIAPLMKVAENFLVILTNSGIGNHLRDVPTPIVNELIGQLPLSHRMAISVRYPDKPLRAIDSILRGDLKIPGGDFFRPPKVA